MRPETQLLADLRAAAFDVGGSSRPLKMGREEARRYTKTEHMVPAPAYCPFHPVTGEPQFSRCRTLSWWEWPEHLRQAA